MANIHGVKGRAWSSEEVEIAQEMARAGIHPRDIAVELDRTVSSIEGKLRLVRNAPLLERGGVPERIESDERKHLQALYAANGYGFGWWPPSLMERVYLLEQAPAGGRPFWNAA